MKNVFAILLSLLFISNISAFAQDYEFKILASKGKNEVKSGGSWSPLKVGGSIKKTDELRVGANAYLGLIHSTGKPIELKEQKTYKVSELVTKLKSGPTVLNKYTDFIISSNTQKRNNLTATGAVHRGVNKIRVFLPKPEVSYVYGDSVTIQWDKNTGAGPYIVKFSSFFGDELLTAESKTNTLTFNLADPSFANENEFQVQVFSKSDKKESEPYTIRKLKKDERARLQPLVKDVLTQTKENTAISKIIQAGFFEKEKLYIDAATAYQAAVRIEPALQEQYDEFLIRNAMNEAKKK